MEPFSPRNSLVLQRTSGMSATLVGRASREPGKHQLAFPFPYQKICALTPKAFDSFAYKSLTVVMARGTLALPFETMEIRLTECFGKLASTLSA